MVKILSLALPGHVVMTADGGMSRREATKDATTIPGVHLAQEHSPQRRSDTDPYMMIFARTIQLY